MVIPERKKMLIFIYVEHENLMLRSINVTAPECQMN